MAYHVLALFFLHLAFTPFSVSLPFGGSEQAIFNTRLTSSLGVINETINAFMQERNIPGLSLAVSKDDRLVYAAGFGYADREREELVNTEHRFRLGSVSKPMTAISIMHLVEQGELTLTDKIFGEGAIFGHQFGHNAYTDYELGITVQHLLEHSTGFVDSDMGEDPTYKREWIAQDHNQLITTILDTFNSTHAPGTFADYSNFGFIMAGRVIESITNQSYESYVRDNFLLSIGITDMEVANDSRKSNEVVYYDDANPGKPYNFHVSRRDSVGAWIATPTDLIRVLASVDGRTERPEFLNATTRELMFEESPVEGSHYAKGWTVAIEEGQLIEVSKSGSLYGTTAFVSIKLPSGLSYAIVVNCELSHGREMKAMMDKLVEKVEEWPNRDLFEDSER